jgi:hypothetical protein
MAEQSRKWVANEAKRSHVPLLIGIMGPAGGGKTLSALRLAGGIQRVVGGDIYGVDTESNRMLHYADDPDLIAAGVKFRHVPFAAPFSSAAYKDCLEWCVGQGAKTIIVDSMSHEHAGADGYLEMADQSTRKDVGKWAEPAKSRSRLIQAILQMDVNIVFTFRAKEKLRPVPGKEPLHLGFMPIAGIEFLYELTVCCLLMPVAGGVPTWKSVEPGESMMIKPARQFADIFDNYGIAKTPLSEKHGEGLALWARGKVPAAQDGSGRPSATAGPNTRPESAPGPGDHGGSTAPRSEADQTWNHSAWAATFEASLGELKTLADFDAVWGDESNRDLIQQLAERDLDRAKALRATASGKRKALKTLEPAEKIGEM